MTDEPMQAGWGFTRDKGGNITWASPEAEAKARQFWHDSRAKVNRGNCDFHHVCFPPDPDHYGFGGLVFKADADFRGAVFLGHMDFQHTRFACGAYFRDAQFHGDAVFRSAQLTGESDFGWAVFRGGADIERAQFGGDVLFSGARFYGNADLAWAQFNGKAGFRTNRFLGEANFARVHFGDEADFAGAGFKSRARFAGAQFEGGARLDGAEFSGAADFGMAKFSGGASFFKGQFSGTADFSMVRFNGAAVFFRAEFSGTADFKWAKFSGTSFNSARFIGGVDFRGAQFRGDASFDSARFVGEADFDEGMSDGIFSVDLPSGRDEERTPFRRRGEGAGAYRLAKQSAMDRGDYHLAGEYHYAEQCTLWWGNLKRCWGDLIGGRGENESIRHRVYRGIRGGGHIPISLVGFLLGRVVFGYGERIARPILSALVVIAVWTGLYYHYGIKDPSGTTTQQVTHELGSCLYFSVVTFTTLGYGDLRPIATTGLRLLAASEALIGAFLMALFVVAMARKFTR